MEDDLLYLKVENSTLITYPPSFEHERKEGQSLIAFPSEQVNSFLKDYNIEPTYIDPDYVYGYYDEVNRNWTGMMGHVSRPSYY